MSANSELVSVLPDIKVMDESGTGEVILRLCCAKQVFKKTSIGMLKRARFLSLTLIDLLLYLLCAV